MDWSELTTISTFDDENTGLIHKCSDSCHSINDPMGMELTTAKSTTAVSLLIEALVQLICKLIEDDNGNIEMSCKIICEKLTAMFLIDESYELNEFADIRRYFKKQIYEIVRAVGLGQQKVPIQFSTNKYKEICTESRYKGDFEEIRFIAGGGFGKVFQARHKLDSIDYAVKQIKISSRKIKLANFSEVKTIASLNHPSIVQYKSAWLEPILPELEEREYSTNANYQIYTNRPSRNTNLELVQYTRSSKYNSDYSPQIPKNAMLYIQMALCKLTLKEWLFSKNNSNEISNINIAHNIFYQILDGLDYCHSKQIIHHDIKPSNIFLDFQENGDIIARLGDFGLACPFQDEHKGYPLGTKPYAAPEQLQGECNPKSDLYSLGIVFLELLIKCNTDMERSKIIEDARKGIYPSEITKPSIQLLNSLLSSKNNRPTTTEVLKLLNKLNIEKHVWPQVKNKDVETERKKIISSK